jgi:L-fucose isomerase
MDMDPRTIKAVWGFNGTDRPGAVYLAAILRIPVCMHNLGAERIFRPSYWNSFGMDKEGADYRACAAPPGRGVYR